MLLGKLTEGTTRGRALAPRDAPWPGSQCPARGRTPQTLVVRGGSTRGPKPVTVAVNSPKSRMLDGCDDPVHSTLADANGLDTTGPRSPVDHTAEPRVVRPRSADREEFGRRPRERSAAVGSLRRDRGSAGHRARDRAENAFDPITSANAFLAGVRVEDARAFDEGILHRSRRERANAVRIPSPLCQ